MPQLPEDPPWMKALTRIVARLGFASALLVVTLLVFALALAAAAAVLTALGRGVWPAAFALAASSALVLGPALGAALVSLTLALDRGRQAQASQDAAGPAATPARNHFLHTVEREWARSRRYGEDGALLLIDADRFKSIVETHGAACGELLLREITRQATQTLRQPDLLARFSGDGLVVYLPNTDPLGALDVAERLREKAAAACVRWNDATVQTTASIGVASVGASHVSLDLLIQDAGQALQAAKAAGHNCVRAAPVQPRSAPTFGPSVRDTGPAGSRG